MASFHFPAASASAACLAHLKPFYNKLGFHCEEVIIVNHGHYKRGRPNRGWHGNFNNYGIIMICGHIIIWHATLNLYIYIYTASH